MLMKEKLEFKEIMQLRTGMHSNILIKITKLIVAKGKRN